MRPPCDHNNFAAEVAVARLTSTDGGPVTSYLAEIRIRCEQCGIPFEFRGLETGLNLQGAAMSIDAQEANLAIIPQGTEPTPLDIIGYRIRGHQS